jgi:hypothetical protein
MAVVLLACYPDFSLVMFVFHSRSRFVLGERRRCHLYRLCWDCKKGKSSEWKNQFKACEGFKAPTEPDSQSSEMATEPKRFLPRPCGARLMCAVTQAGQTCEKARIAAGHCARTALATTNAFEMIRKNPSGKLELTVKFVKSSKEQPQLKMTDRKLRERAVSRRVTE